MTKIGLLSDTHGYLDDSIFEHFKHCDEVWHIGDFGQLPINATKNDVIDLVQNNSKKEVDFVVDKNEPKITLNVEDTWANIFKENIYKLSSKNIIFRGVYGNIDDQKIRGVYPEKMFFTCEKVPVYLQHIGGYPSRYAKGVKEAIVKNNIKLFISGHSHILKIMYDKSLGCLHINPGAAGKQGWHKVRTVIRFAIDDGEMKDCEVIEL